MALQSVLGTGLSGLVGTKIVELLSDEYTFTNLDLSNGVDILNAETVETAVKNSDAQSLIHCAAFTNVNAAQEQQGDKNGACYQVNVVGTRNIAESCARHGKHLIHLSTGYVFDGQKAEPYVETDTKNPTDWYSQTKAEAENVIAEVIPNATIFRINFPYRQDTFDRPDIWHKIEEGLKAGKRGPFFDDHTFTLTPVEWFAEVMRWALKTKPAGIFHATTDTVYTDLTLAQEVAQSLGITEPLSGSSVHEFNRTTPRPYQPSLILDSSKLKQAMLRTP